MFVSSSQKYTAEVETYSTAIGVSLSLGSHKHTHAYSHLITSAKTHTVDNIKKWKNKSCTFIEMWIHIRQRQKRHLKALWHTINGLKVYWHVSVLIRSIFAAPLRRLRRLVSTDTQLFDSLSRLCHVHVGLSLWLKIKIVRSEHTHTCDSNKPSNSH